MPELLLGVDGGGTKTVAWLGTVDRGPGEPIWKGKAGAGNPRAVGFEMAFENIQAAIAEAFATAGLQTRPARSACIALAGADRASERARIEAWASERQLADRLYLTNDARPLLALASPDDVGLALICGTGSIAYGRNRSGETDRCGGWGYLLGDEGSGYDIARRGLRAAARAADGRGPPTSLLDRFLQRLGLTNPQQIIETIYHPDCTRRRIAELASTVFDAANELDEVGVGIIRSAAENLAEMLAALQNKLSLHEGAALALAGGVLVHRPEFVEAILHHLDHRPTSTIVVAEPASGALLIASRELQKSIEAS